MIQINSTQESILQSLNENPHTSSRYRSSDTTIHKDQTKSILTDLINIF